MDAAMNFVSNLGIILEFRSNTNSPRLLWNRFSGFYLVQLHIKTDLGRDDSHFVGYQAAANLIMVNYPRSKLPKIEAKDRKRKNAPKVFYALFLGARQITIPWARFTN